MTNDPRIERLYALAEKLGRLTAQAHNLASDLSAKMAAHRVATRSTDPAKPPPASRPKKS
jgi:hypothetical protein